MSTQSTTATIVELDTTQHVEPIRIIRKINGLHQFVILSGQGEMTPDERRELFVATFNPCGLE